jgi:hypothetical protein
MAAGGNKEDEKGLFEHVPIDPRIRKLKVEG